MVQAPQPMRESTDCREGPLPKVLSVTQTAPSVNRSAQLLPSAPVSSSMQNQNVFAETRPLFQMRSLCHASLQRGFVFSVCVCCEGTRGKALESGQTSAAGVSRPWMVGVRSVGVDLSHPASEVGRVGTGPFPCHQSEATGADGGREDVACRFGQTRCFSPRGELLSSIREAGEKAYF